MNISGFLKSSSNRREAISSIVKSVSVLLVAVASLTASFNATAATAPVASGDDSAQCAAASNKSKSAYRVVDKMPTFPGGDAGIIQFISSNLQYPKDAWEKCVQGTVIVQFVVTETGAVDEIKVAHSVDPALDKEAVRVCQLLPKFEPAMKDGKPVAIWYSLPFNFKVTK